jgi:CheY-like chemotaxis protein
VDKKFVILVADDDSDDFNNLNQAFDDLGYNHQLEHVYDGQQLLNRLITQFQEQHSFPDLVLLDINMPKVNGLQALKKIRAMDVFANVPVLMHSTCSYRPQVAACYAMGANGFLSKGSSYSAILSLVKEIVSFLNYIERFPGDAAAKLHRSVS